MTHTAEPTITALTREQQRQQARFIDRWRAVEERTGPADRTAAEQAIRRAYEAVGWVQPKAVAWFASPMSKVLTRFILDEHAWEQDGDTVRITADPSLRGCANEQVWSGVEANVATYAHVYRHDPHINGGYVLGDAFYRAKEHVRKRFSAELWEGLSDRFERSVGRDLGWFTRTALWKAVPHPVTPLIGSVGNGQYEAPALAIFDFAREVLGLHAETERMVPLFALARSAGSCATTATLCWASERPSAIHWDEQGELHNLDGPAIVYPDGWGVFAINGVPVHKDVVLRPEQLTVQRIEQEENIEVRRIMVERFGPGRYLQESGAVLVAEDEFGRLWRKNLWEDESLVMVELRNATPEPDGTHKVYWLRVPPNIQTPHAAVAWSFGMTPKEYRPAVES